MPKVQLKKTRELQEKQYQSFKYILEQLDKQNQRISELEGKQN